MIVRCNDDERHLFDSGEVHAFMKRAGLHPAFADATQADKVFFAAESLRHQSTDRDRDHCAEVTNHGELIVPWSAAMNVAVASAHWALSRAQISTRDIDKRFAERRPSRLIANQRREDVALLQEQSAGHANRFLPTADVDATRDQTAAIETYELFFERTREQHPTKRFEKALMRRGFRCCGFFAARRRFKHSGILPKFDKCAQNFFEIAWATSLWQAQAASLCLPIARRSCVLFARLRPRIGAASRSLHVRWTASVRRQLAGVRSISSQRACSLRALPSSPRKAHRLLQSCVCCAS